ncbi:MAG: DUF3842 family protein [Clostridiales bacterium]|jgi:hypothetical protein|nr:DUF3842 family protein [Clostridiales bacterium]
MILRKVVVIDGQGGGIGRFIIEQIKALRISCAVYAIGTNSTATAAMLKAGADYGATGENPIIANCRDADVVVGPIGIVIADAMLGEITPAAAAAVGRCGAHKVLLPINRCGSFVVGVKELSANELVGLAAEQVALLLGHAGLEHRK